MNYPAASSGVSKFQRFGESQAQQAAGNMTPRDLNALAALNAHVGNGKPIEAADYVGERRLQGRHPRRPPRRHEMPGGNQLASAGTAE